MVTQVEGLIFEMWFLEAKFYENMDNRVQPRTVLTVRLEMMLISCVLIQVAEIHDFGPKNARVFIFRVTSDLV